MEEMDVEEDSGDNQNSKTCKVQVESPPLAHLYGTLQAACPSCCQWYGTVEFNVPLDTV